jgi:hypothetical protein
VVMDRARTSMTPHGPGFLKKSNDGIDEHYPKNDTAVSPLDDDTRDHPATMRMMTRGWENCRRIRVIGPWVFWQVMALGPKCSCLAPTSKWSNPFSVLLSNNATM